MLHTDEKALSKRVPLRYVKRPYANLDERKVKGAANRKRWEERAQQRADATAAKTAEKAKRAAKAAKAAKRANAGDSGAGGDDAGAGTSGDADAAHGDAALGKKRKRRDSDAMGSGDHDSAQSRSSKAKRGRAGADGAPASLPPSGHSGVADPKAEAKAARLQKNGVSAERLKAFARLAGKSKKGGAKQQPAA